jgi:hypothetical protein
MQHGRKQTRFHGKTDKTGGVLWVDRVASRRS